MNKAQFRGARLQLGMNTDAFGTALGLRMQTILKLETGAPPLSDTIYNKRASLNHLMSFAVAWMLFNGGPLIPWDRSEDATKMRAFKDSHGMSVDEMAALFCVSKDEMDNYLYDPNGDRRPGKITIMAMCWMRIFGSRDPFAFPLHEHYTAESVST